MDTVSLNGQPPDAEKMKDEIISFCRRQLAPYKVPKLIEFRDELPKNIIGKTLRRSLREEETRR